MRLLVLFALFQNCVYGSDACEPASHDPTPSQWLPVQSCCAWFSSISLQGGPALPLPSTQRAEFSMWGKAEISEMFFASPYFGRSARTPHWSRAMIDDYVVHVTNGDISRENHKGASKTIIESLRAFGVRGLRGAVFGSETPWVEAILLSEGAEHVTTIEFGKITTDHPQVSTLTIPELKGNVSTNATNILQFDFVMAYSSLEHSGMGRYGDALAPFADLEWIERIKCLLKPGGFLYFGAPMSDVDCVVWNAHRIYGPARLEALQHGFHRRLQIGRKGTGCKLYTQPILVLQKPHLNVIAGLFDAKAIAVARLARQKWVANIDQIIEEMHNRLPSAKGWPEFGSLGHRLFDVIGPIGPPCSTKLEIYGRGDEEKRVCGLSLVRGPCIVVSVGSNNQWDFEEAVIRQTKCRVVTFDCTCGTLRPPAAILDRLTAVPVCIGRQNFVNEKGWRFMTWRSALAFANVSHVTHLKMDIEGFEYDVMREIVHHDRELLPGQISLELHYQTQMTDLAWHRRYKTPAEVAFFITTLFTGAGYFIIDRHDNPYCRHCSELLLARFSTEYGLL